MPPAWRIRVPRTGCSPTSAFALRASADKSRGRGTQVLKSPSLLRLRVLPCSHPKQRLDRTAVVHGLVGLGYVGKRHFQIEDFAGVDLARHDEVDEVRQEAAHRSRTAQQV